MAVSKLICPECETELRPAKPLPPGKKVKCPNCSTTFKVPEEEEEPAPSPVRSQKKAAPVAQPEKKEPEKTTGLQFETSTYAVVKDKSDEQKAEEKEDRGDELMAQFLKIKKSKDPRGPAQEAVTRPTNYMILTGSLGAICYAILLVFWIIFFLMPAPQVEDLEEGAKKMKYKGLSIGSGVGAVAYQEDPQKKDQEEEVKRAKEQASIFAQLAFISALGWILFLLSCFLFLIGIGYCAAVIYGAVKIQNLTERTWGFVSSIMCMIPVTGLAFMMITLPLVFILFALLYSDPTVVFIFTIAVAVGEVAWMIGIGIWTIKTIMDPAVIAGFEYIEDED